jgi:hypothetical protein
MPGILIQPVDDDTGPDQLSGRGFFCLAQSREVRIEHHPAGFVENLGGLIQAPVALGEGLSQRAFYPKPGGKHHRYCQNSRVHK